MKKMIYISVLFLIATGGIFWSCQKDEFEGISNEELALKKVTIQEVTDVLNWDTPVCAGNEQSFCLEFPQALKGNGETKKTNGQVQLKVYGDDPSTIDEVETEYWIQIANDNADTKFYFTYIFTKSGTYYLRFKANDAQWNFTTFIVPECCTPGFTYIDNGDKTYTFTLVPDEDTEDALLEFTFAQGVAVSGLTGFAQNGNSNSSVWSATMDLFECETYSWIVTLVADCNGNSKNSNVWTDFKVNSISQKANSDDKFVQVCP